jgi:hypothetical protein
MSNKQPLFDVVVLNVTQITYAVQELLGVPYRRPIIWVKPKPEYQQGDTHG